MVNELTNWVIIVFAVLLGLGIVYALVRIIIASVSPQIDDKIERSLIEREAKRHFGFLLEKGYKISHLDYVNHPLNGWHLQIRSPDSEMFVILDQQEAPLLAFGKDRTDKRYQIFLDAMIYYLTEGKVFIGRSYRNTAPSRNQEFRSIAKLLKTYINQIENYRQNDFEKTKDELSNLQDQYSNLLIQEFEQQPKTR